MLLVQTAWKAKEVLLTVTGDLERTDNLHEIANCVDQLLQMQPHKMVIDLSRFEHMSARLCGLLVSFWKQCKKRMVDLVVVVEPSGPLFRLLDLTNLTSLFTIACSQDRTELELSDLVV